MPHILTIKSTADYLKYQLFNEKDKEISSGCIEEIPDYDWAIKQILRNIKDVQEISAVGHYIAYGGEEFIEPVIIDNEILNILGEISESNLYNIDGIRACTQYLDLPQVVVFDSAFMAPALVGAGLETHGLAHQGAMHIGMEKNKKKANEINIISCCLDNSCSAAAIRKGKPIDISDDALLGNENQDFGYLLREATFSREAKMALDLFILKIIKNIGGAYAVLNGKVDAVVLSGDIFINKPTIKQKVIQGLDFLGKKSKVLVAESQEGLMMGREIRKVLK